MVISGFILYVCKTGYYNCLQTNNIGTFMVPYTTYTNNYHVYVCIRRISWDIYRWSSTITFYMSGILLWNYFNTVFMLSSNIFIANANIFGKVYFPRLVVPLSGIASNLVKLGIHLCLFIVIYLYYYIQGADLTISWTVLLFPFLIFMIAFHAMSWGLIISALTTKYRDLTQLISFGIQLFMYLTPVVYPLSATPQKYYSFISLNPLTPIFETFRYSWMGSGALDWGGLGYSFIILLCSLFLSVVIFSRVERNFMDTV